MAIDSMIGETADLEEVIDPAEAPRYDTPELRSASIEYQVGRADDVIKKMTNAVNGEVVQ